MLYQLFILSTPTVLGYICAALMFQEGPMHKNSGTGDALELLNWAGKENFCTESHACMIVIFGV